MDQYAKNYKHAFSNKSPVFICPKGHKAHLVRQLLIHPSDKNQSAGIVQDFFLVQGRFDGLIARIAKTWL